MNPKGLAQQQNIEGMNSQIKEKLNSLRQIPQELVGKIPASVWASLTADHRAEMLKQYGIYEKYLQIELQAQQLARQEVSPIDSSISTEVSLEQLNQVKSQVAQQAQQQPMVVDVTRTTEIQGKSQFAEAVAEKNKIEATNRGLKVEQSNQIPSVEKQVSVESVAEKIPVKRMQMENPQDVINNQNIKSVEKVVPKFSGYPVAEDISKNVNHIEEHGSPRDGATWTASFIKKIWAIFTN